jgi:hypothetical protein
MTHTGNTSSLQCQEVGGEDGGCDMVLLSVFSLFFLICE